MAIFAIPGLMPTGQPKYESLRSSNADGSLELCVYEVEASTQPPRVNYKIADGAGCVIVQDLTGATVFQEISGSFITGVIRIDAGILPIGLLTAHLEYINLDNPNDYVDYDIEVPGSPFHVPSVLDL